MRALEAKAAMGDGVDEPAVERVMKHLLAATASNRHPATFSKKLRTELWGTVAAVCTQAALFALAKKACSYVLAIVTSMSSKQRQNKKGL